MSDRPPPEPVWREVARLRSDALAELSPRALNRLKAAMVTAVAEAYPDALAWTTAADTESRCLLVSILVEPAEALPAPEDDALHI